MGDETQYDTHEAYAKCYHDTKVLSTLSQRVRASTLLQSSRSNNIKKLRILVKTITWLSELSSPEVQCRQPRHNMMSRPTTKQRLTSV
jgi:hypothetical protein